MARENWRDDTRGDPDYGQADYSRDYGYDPRTRSGYRRDRDDYDRERFRSDGPYDPERPARQRLSDEDRSFDERRRHRRGPSDRVLWAVIMERLERDRRVDMRDVRISVHDGEVTLDGTVRTKEGKRRIEDLVDVDGVRNVQNNLRPRDAERRWVLF